MTTTLTDTSPASVGAVPDQSPEGIRIWIAAKLRMAGKKVPKCLEQPRPAPPAATNRSGAPPDPFAGREVTGLFLAPNGELVKLIRVGPDEPPQFAEPSSPWSTNEDDDGRARGDEGIEERRREEDLRREITIGKKRARGAAFADRATWAAKVEALEKELAEMLEARRRKKVERDFGMGEPGRQPTGA